MIIVKNRELNKDSIEVLNQILNMDIPAVSAFKLMKITKELDDIVKNRQDSEVKLVRKYAVKDDDGNVKQSKDERGNPVSFEIEDDKSDIFNKEINDLLDYENEINFQPISINDLESVKISASNLMKIGFLFSE